MFILVEGGGGARNKSCDLTETLLTLFRLVEGGGGARSKSCDLTETPLTLADTQLTMLEDQQV